MDAVFEPAGLVADGSGRLAVALVLGSLVGLQREIDDQPAGLRTHLTVCLGSALFGAISTLGFVEFERIGDVGAGGTNLSADVTRVASQVVVGIGFLGAGILIRRGEHVRNVTTAASIWATAAVGLAAGVGNSGLAVVTTALLLVTLSLLRVPRDWIRRRLTREVRQVRIKVRPGTDIAAIEAELSALDGVRAHIVGVGKSGGMLDLTLLVEGRPGVSPELSLVPLLDSDNVVDFRITDDGEVD